MSLSCVALHSRRPGKRAWNSGPHCSWPQQIQSSKELHFTSPVTFASMQRPAKFGRWDSGQPSSSSPNVPGQHKGQTGKGKGKGKKGKGGRYQSTFLPGTKLELVTHTADGREICYKFNMRGNKCDGKCGRVHVCRVKGCGQQHAAADHPADS